MLTSDCLLLSAACALLIATTVMGQRSSPQFSFPPPNALAAQFGSGSDVFNPSTQELSLVSSQTGNSQVSNGAGSAQLSPMSTLTSSSLGDIGTNQGASIAADQGQLVATSVSQAPQQKSQEQQQPQQQPSIQLSRPTLSLTSLTGNQQQQQSAQVQPSSSSQASSNFRQQAQPQAPQTAGPSALSLATSAGSHQSNRNANSQPKATSGATSASGAHHNHHHKSSQNSASSSSSSAGSSQQPIGGHHQHHHPANLHTQATSQSLSGQNNAAAIEAARKAEATAASLAASSSGQSYHCPDSFGFFRHHKSCDKYWACENGTSTLKLCGNGLMFDDSDPKRENCAYPFSVDCGADRTEVESPISTPHCPRLYGLFSDNANCRVFYSCWNGESSKYECPPGLAYDNEQRVCVWADLVDRCDQSEVSDGFVCPDPTEADQPGHYTRHAHPTDCRKFYVCIEGVARPYGCSFGTVFNVDSLQCDEPDNVSGCEKYYGDMDPKLAKKLAKEGTQGQGQGAQQQQQASGSSTNSRSSSSSSSSTSG